MAEHDNAILGVLLEMRDSLSRTETLLSEVVARQDDHEKRLRTQEKTTRAFPATIITALIGAIVAVWTKISM